MAKLYTGTIAGVTFEDGRPVNEDNIDVDRAGPAIAGYIRRHGLRIDEDDRLVVPDPDEPAVHDHPTHAVVGTRLRDAALDPRAGDFLEPVNAGQDHPHSPDVVAPHVHGSQGNPPGGQVPADPDAQEAVEKTDRAAEVDVAVVEPSGNASTDEWRTYALSLPDVTEADLEGLSRNELRDRYSS